MRYFIASLFLVPALAACTLEPPVSTRSTTLDEKALYASEVAYNSAANIYLEAVASGALTDKQPTKTKLIKAYGYLRMLRTAYAAGDQASFNSTIVLFNEALK